MPGFFDFLGGLLGGGGNVDPANIVSDVPGLVDTPNYLNTVGDFFNGGGPSPLDFASFAGGFGGGSGGGSPIDWGSTTPFDATTLPTADPASILTNVPGLTPTSAAGGGGGIGSSLPGILRTVGPRVLGGFGGGGSPTAAPPQGAVAGRPGATPAAGGGNPAQGGIPGVPGTAPGGAGGIPGILGNLTGGVGGLGGLTAGLGLISSLLKGDKLPPQADQLTSLANSLGDQAKNQVLPTALANQQGFINDQALGRVNRTLQQNESSIRDSYSRMGMSGSTMEAEDLQNARQSADQEVFQIGQTMATTGLQTAMQMFGDQSSIMQELMQAQIEQDKALSDAITAFADAAVYGSRDPQPAQGSPGQAGPSGGNPAAIPGQPPQAAPPQGAPPGETAPGISDVIPTNDGFGLPEPLTVAPPVQPVAPPDLTGLVDTPALLDRIGALLG